MIVVIADDITGAAEMGGMALRFGLEAVVTEDVGSKVKADVLVVYTDTRSMKKDQAVEIMAQLANKAVSLHPSLFYKKTDSVLRGHILPEMKAQMLELNFIRGLLVPVNPSLGRIIKDGNYYVNGTPVHQTGFSSDPEFPITSSSVLEMLGDENVPVSVVKPGDSLNEKGVFIGEAKTDEDILAWAYKIDKKTLAAGGASFFYALLSINHDLDKEQKKPIELSSPLLLISGTTFQENVHRIKGYSHLVSYMPEDLLDYDQMADLHFENWADEILERLSKYNKAIIAIDHSGYQKNDPGLFREKKAKIAEIILKRIKLKELLIEGGATAYSIIKKIGWQSFTPTEELKQGVVRMQVGGLADLHLTIKPGSYEWPTEWNFNS